MSRTFVKVAGAVFFAFFLLASENATAAENRVAGRITQVTLYRGQAMVTRTIPIEGPAGPREIVVGDLPEQIMPDSLFAEGKDSLEVRAVRFRAKASETEPREEVRKLDQAIEDTEEKMKANQKRREVLGRRMGYLDQLESFVTVTSRNDLARGVLDANALQKMTTFSFEQREKAAQDFLAAEKETHDLFKQRTLLQRKREELTRGAAHTIREAVLFIEKHGDAKTGVQLNYLVGGCGWSPSYAIRAEKDGKKVNVECNALIRQMTGEEWANVELTLSTASPSLSAAGMGLAPFSVTLTKGAGNVERLNAADFAARAQVIVQAKREAVEMNRRSARLEDSIGASWMANVAADKLQNMELIFNADPDKIGQARSAANAEGPSLSYSLAGAVSLASRNDQQMVRILRTALESRFYHVATPVLTGYVYREAEMTNTGNDDLLAGPVAVYLDGRFVGHSEIPTVARGETFVVGFGADPQLRTKRELVARTENVQGGNRELSFKYRLVLENYKNQPVNVRLFDRIPHNDRPTEVRVKLGDLRDQLSKNDLYLRTERPKGILRWDVEVPANAAGEKVRIVEYDFTLEFDRNFSMNMTALAEISKQIIVQEEEVENRREPARKPLTNAPAISGMPQTVVPQYGGFDANTQPNVNSPAVSYPQLQAGAKSDLQIQFEQQQRAKLKQ